MFDHSRLGLLLKTYYATYSESTSRGYVYWKPFTSPTLPRTKLIGKCSELTFNSNVYGSLLSNSNCVTWNTAIHPDIRRVEDFDGVNVSGS